jgi:hypothetical protein
MDLITLQSNIAKLDVVEMGYNILDDMSDFIADLNRKRLAEKGEDSNSNNIGDYTETTVILKEAFGRGIGKITDHVTGYNTGESHKNIFASVISDELIVDTTTSQWEEFEDHYNNKEILGLTVKEMQLVSKEFDKRFFKELESAILR